MCLSRTLSILEQRILSLTNTLKGQLTIFEMEIVSCVGLRLLICSLLILANWLHALILPLVHFHYSRACRGPILY